MTFDKELNDDEMNPLGVGIVDGMHHAEEQIRMGNDLLMAQDHSPTILARPVIRRHKIRKIIRRAKRTAFMKPKIRTRRARFKRFRII